MKTKKTNVLYYNLHIVLAYAGLDVPDYESENQDKPTTSKAATANLYKKRKGSTIDNSKAKVLRCAKRVAIEKIAALEQSEDESSDEQIQANKQNSDSDQESEASMDESPCQKKQLTIALFFN